MLTLQQCARRMLWKRRLPGLCFWNRLRFRREHPALEREVFGIHFRHPVGLAPVLERQAELLDVCDSIGYSFTGVIPGDMPVQTVAEFLQARKSPIIASVELRAEGASEEEAMQALVRRFSLLYDFADYFVIDINRESGLSSLDDFSDWTALLDELLSLRLYYERYKPILLRIAPGHSTEQMTRILDFCLMSNIDGIIAPGAAKVRFCVEYTHNRIPVVGSGAVTSPEEALALLEAGATLIEVAQGIRNKPRQSAKLLLEAIDQSLPSK
jgi:dihydroorotate dehydrogenase